MRPHSLLTISNLQQKCHKEGSCGHTAIGSKVSLNIWQYWFMTCFKQRFQSIAVLYITIHFKSIQSIISSKYHSTVISSHILFLLKLVCLKTTGVDVWCIPYCLTNVDMDSEYHLHTFSYNTSRVALQSSHENYYDKTEKKYEDLATVMTIWTIFTTCVGL